MLIITAIGTGFLTSTIFVMSYRKGDRNKFLEVVMSLIGAILNISVAYLLYTSESSKSDTYFTVMLATTGGSGVLFTYDFIRQYMEGY